MSAEEEWRPVPGYPSYEVSSLGRVRSRRCVLKPWLNRNGYLYVTLGRHKKCSVHALVAETFHGPRATGQVVRHLNGDPTCNLASNLAIGSQSENSYDAVRHGTHAMVKRTHCPHGHEYAPENVLLYRGRRFCRTCKRDRSREYAQRLARAS